MKQFIRNMRINMLEDIRERYSRVWRNVEVDVVLADVPYVGILGLGELI